MKKNFIFNKPSFLVGAIAGTVNYMLGFSIISWKFWIVLGLAVGSQAIGAFAGLGVEE